MLARLLSALVVLVVAALAVVFTWPQAFGLQNEWVISHVVALRGAAVVCALIAAVVFGLLSFAKPLRGFTIGLVVILLVYAGANVAILSARGFGGEAAPADETSESITVLSWNTLGEVPEASTIAELALERGADIVSLPETTEPLGEEVAIAMREGGRPMWVKTIAFDQIAKARSTTLLISPDLGDYEVVSAEGSGPPGNTNTLPTVVAAPVNGEGPTIVAVHAVAPIRWEMRNWRSDLDWLAEQCAGDDVIMAGDFNATVDHFAGRGAADLGNCADAAVAAGSAGLGTWPTDLPALLGSPIDHVLATPNWTVTSFDVLDEYDDSGSDHRPVVATLERAG
ncbi:endonuclease/exonuclease/phosphatase family protein [Agromyces atrinae]|uniref:Endonuclease/exonuclease/phosphatase (EEP) superfamily protein YafD n=1 Tax=Agromyces atrinae TaxID=592376 RepID=A0A4Q2M787_9MICO|nr:endonuclease/exonuclease/phosphatase family protein [Agromyces atrinae]NYD65586.1 endonuclease/exonuclease/phosphatase (EEP) superfamily protein YafD [Agromyces atrinae]RXZ85020.1 endonuclease/exonuclease/phosphatase family protein [Agromyces atrinae]